MSSFASTRDNAIAQVLVTRTVERTFVKTSHAGFDTKLQSCKILLFQDQGKEGKGKEGKEGKEGRGD